MDRSEIFVSHSVSDGRAKLAEVEVEAAMTPAVLQMLALGPGGVVTTGGRSNFQRLQSAYSYRILANNGWMRCRTIVSVHVCLGRI